MQMTEEFVYVQEAARLADCSTKTLYRHMKHGKLDYKISEDQRRLIRAVDAMAVATNHRRANGAQPNPLPERRLARIEQKLDEVLTVQRKLLELYQPKSLATLASKHTRSP